VLEQAQQAVEDAKGAGEKYDKKTEHGVGACGEEGER